MTLGLGLLFWVIVIVAAVFWFVDYRATRISWPILALIACTIILGIAEFGGLHVAGR